MTLSTTRSQNKSGVKDLVLFYSLFSVLLVIVDACLSRWKDVYLLELEEKTVAVDKVDL